MGFLLTPQPSNIVAKRGQRRFGNGSLETSSKDQALLHWRENLDHDWMLKEIPGTLYGTSGKGIKYAHIM